ncbi:MAG: hypothetical protein ACW991_10935 [Candidatus Hodarchaeales archaeon]
MFGDNYIITLFSGKAPEGIFTGGWDLFSRKNGRKERRRKKEEKEELPIAGGFIATAQTNFRDIQFKSSAPSGVGPFYRERKKGIEELAINHTLLTQNGRP